MKSLKEKLVLGFSYCVAIAFLAMLVASMLATEASALGRRRGGGGSVSAGMVYTVTAESTDKLYDEKTVSLMDVAQARADAMAQYGSLSHGIHRFAKVRTFDGLGVWEGIGYSGYTSDPKAVETCICGSRVVADAFARSASGLIYRVRFFRN